MAPEVISSKAYDSRADIWSLGITALELVHGKPPLAEDYPPMKVLFMIPQLDPPTLDGDEFSAEFKDFIRNCLVREPRNRPEARALLNHPFILRAGRTNELIPLIARYQKWKEDQSSGKSQSIPGKQQRSQEATVMPDYRDTIARDGWVYDTIVEADAVDAGRSTIKAGSKRPTTTIATMTMASQERSYRDDDEHDLEKERQRLATVQIRDFAINEPVPDLLRSSRAGSQINLQRIRTPDQEYMSSESSAETGSSMGTVRPVRHHVRQEATPTGGAGVDVAESVSVIGRARGHSQNIMKQQAHPTIIDEVVLPSILSVQNNAESEAEHQALMKIREGFTALNESNPMAGEQLMMRILSGMRQSNTVKTQLDRAMRTRSSLITLRGTFDKDALARADDVDIVVDEDKSSNATTISQLDRLEVPSNRNDVADLLYGRWFDALRLKWLVGAR